MIDGTIVVDPTEEATNPEKKKRSNGRENLPQRISPEGQALAARIKAFMDHKGIDNANALAKYAKENKVNISPDAIRTYLTGVYPGREAVRKEIDRLLKIGDKVTPSQPQKAEQPKREPQINTLKTEVRPQVQATVTYIRELSTLLTWMVFTATEADRHKLRELLGPDHDDFISLVRAITNEQTRGAVLRDQQAEERSRNGNSNTIGTPKN